MKGSTQVRRSKEFNDVIDVNIINDGTVFDLRAIKNLTVMQLNAFSASFPSEKFRTFFQVSE